MERPLGLARQRVSHAKRGGEVDGGPLEIRIDHSRRTRASSAGIAFRAAMNSKSAPGASVRF
jgi:hypothetical protein